MLDLIFIFYSFTLGIAAFFSPCSVGMLPGYITYYLSKNESQNKLKDSLIFGLFAILGFFTIFGLAGIILIYIGQILRQYFPIFSFITGILVTLFGISMLIGKEIKINIPQFKGDRSSYIFGIAYAMGALGCTFPLFATVIFEASNSNFINGLLILLSYIIGISLLMLITSILVVFSRKLLQEKINYAIPIIKKISAIILIIAGLYMAWLHY